MVYVHATEWCNWRATKWYFNTTKSLWGPRGEQHVTIFKELLCAPCIFCLKTAKGLEFRAGLQHFQGFFSRTSKSRSQRFHDMLMFFGKTGFMNSPDLFVWNPLVKKSHNALTCWRYETALRFHLFELVSYNSQSERANWKTSLVRWNGKLIFRAKQVCQEKNVKKTTPSLRLWVVQLLVFQNNNSSSTMPVAGDLGL